MEEKRKNKRLELDSELILNRLDSDSASATRAAIKIKDVSKTGIGFVCDQPLNIGAIYECVLTLWTKEKLNTFIEIVRIIKNDDGTYFYGGIFIGMPEADQSRIAIYTQFVESEVIEHKK